MESVKLSEENTGQGNLLDIDLVNELFGHDTKKNHRITEGKMDYLMLKNFAFQKTISRAKGGNMPVERKYLQTIYLRRGSESLQGRKNLSQ